MKPADLEYLYASFRAPRRMKASDRMRRLRIMLNGRRIVRLKWRAACE